MPFVDSYDALAASIERSLRSDIGASDVTTRLPDSIDHRLREEARTGELVLAYVRCGIALSAVALSLWSLVAPDATRSAQAGGGLLVRAGWLLLAVVLLAALRRGWYRLWLRPVVPIADAAMILGGFVLLWGGPEGAQAVPPAAVGYVTVLCTYLAVSGTMRLSHSGAQLSATLAVGVYLLAAAAARLPLVSSIATAAAIVLLGVLAYQSTALLRRVVAHELGRTELSRVYADARHAIDAREEVLKIVSHDLRNPLSTIAMSAALMLEIEMPRDKQAKQLAIIRRAGERMNRLVQDLLDVAKLEAGRLSIVRRPVEAAALLAEAEECLRPLAVEKSIDFVAASQPGIPELNVDAGRVQQAIGNLVGNAIKFTPAGGQITLRIEQSSGGVRFSVSDTGAGIPSEQLTQIFGRFWQADHADRRGIGLGLAITKAIVEAHGGRIWVDSRVGEGTTFWFTLEARDSESVDASHTFAAP